MKNIRNALFVLIVLAVVVYRADTCLGQPAELGGFSVRTDKNAYLAGERIKFIFQNHSKQSVYSIAASSTPAFAIASIEKKEADNTWKVFQVRCSWPECDIDFDAPAQVKPESSVEFYWMPKIHIKGQADRQLNAGVYRVNINYQVRKGADSKKWENLSLKSSEFRVR